jgi:DNA-directed RNA polymerase specialized sigma24 family protein
MILDILFLKHSVWLNYVKSFGCRNEIAEDYVQEMYIKIHAYSKATNNDLMFNGTEVNYFFVYVTLKNMYFDDLRKAKQRVLINIDDVILVQDETEYREGDFEFKKELLDEWVIDLDKEINEITEYSSYKASLCYIKFIYQKIFIEAYSVTKLAEETNLSYWSIRNTVVRIKKQIKDGS